MVRIGAQNIFGKGGKGVVIRQNGQNRITQILEEALNIRNARAAVDPVRRSVHVNLPGMAGRAGHAHNHFPAIHVRRTSDRQIRFATIRQVQVSVA